MLKNYLDDVYEQMQLHSKVIGIVAALLMTFAVMMHNLFGGPLYNLNDMHNWSNRMIFTGLATFMHFSLLMFLVIESNRDIDHLLVRELLVSISLIIMFLAMNQKTYAYNTQIQPVVRAMDTKALAAIPQFSTGYSIPALTLYYILTRGPIYDMYLAKLFCIGCYELLCICAMHIGRTALEERQKHGANKSWSLECAFALALILPQGFLSSACAAQIEVAGVLLAVLAFILMERNRKLSLIFFGVGASICTGVWLLIPIYVLFRKNWKLRWKDILIPIAAALLCCVPGAIMGSGFKAFTSLLSCVTALPMAGSGVPSLVSFFPRAVMEEIPEYAYLRAVPALDMVTFGAENYKADHFAILMRGLSFACLAIYLGASVYELRHAKVWNHCKEALDQVPESEQDASIRNMAYSPTEENSFCRTLSLLLIAFICVPGLTMGAWQLVTISCIFAIVYVPSLRLPCAVLLFATAGGCAYPVTGEIMIKPVYISIMSLVALGMLMDLWPGKGKMTNG